MFFLKRTESSPIYKQAKMPALTPALLLSMSAHILRKNFREYNDLPRIIPLNKAYFLTAYLLPVLIMRYIETKLIISDRSHMMQYPYSI